MDKLDPADALVFYGGEVKALPNGKVGGHLVLFGSPEEADLSEHRDFFTPETDFGPHKTSSVYYDHGFDPTLGKRVLGSTAELKSDAVGVWIEAQLDVRDKYEAALYELAKKGKLGWSSGTAAHLVEREGVDGASKVLKWPLGLDASLTPKPADPRTLALPLKSLKAGQPFSALVAECEAGAEREPAPMDKTETKGLLDEEYPAYSDNVDEEAMIAAVRTMSDRMNYKLYGALRDGKALPADKVAKADAIMGEFAQRCGRIVRAMLSGNEDGATKALKEFNGDLPDGLPFAYETQTVLATVKGILKRAEDVQAIRAADGRSLSKERRAEIKALADDLAAFYAATEPLAAPEEVLRAYTQYQSTVARINGALKE